jgi:hypothetical protein
LTVCDTLKACYLVNIKTRAEIELDGTDTFELDPDNENGYSIRCDVNGVDELDYIKFFYNSIEQVEYGLPRYMNGDSDEGAYINKVEYLSTCGSKVLKIQGHVWSDLCFENEYMIEVTNADGKPCKDKDPTSAPVKPPTNAPVKPITNAPVKPPTNAPVKPRTDAPVKPRTNAPVKPRTNAPVKPITNAPVKPPTNAPVKPRTDAPVKPRTNAPVKPITNAPVKPPTNAPVKPPTNAPVKAPVKPPTKACTKAPVKSPTGTPVCPYPQEWVNGACKNTCKNDYVCPANSCRITNRLCYDNFDDCSCKHGYYKSTTEDRCIRHSWCYW